MTSVCNIILSLKIPFEKLQNPINLIFSNCVLLSVQHAMSGIYKFNKNQNIFQFSCTLSEASKNTKTIPFEDFEIFHFDLFEYWKFLYCTFHKKVY